MITSVDRVLFLKGVELFSELPGRELLNLATIADEVDYVIGNDIFREGDPGDALFVIVKGQVEVHRGGRSIAILGARETFGEMAILDSEPRSATVTVLEDVVALQLEREPFFELLATKRQIALGIIRMLTRRLRRVISDPAG